MPGQSLQVTHKNWGSYQFHSPQLVQGAKHPVLLTSTHHGNLNPGDFGTKMNQVCCATTGKQGKIKHWRSLKINEDHWRSLKSWQQFIEIPFCTNSATLLFAKAWHQKPPNGPLQLICRTNSEPCGGQKAPYCELLRWFLSFMAPNDL